MVKILQILHQQRSAAVLIELLFFFCCLSESKSPKSPASHRGATLINSQNDQIAQEQRLALHIVTSDDPQHAPRQPKQPLSALEDSSQLISYEDSIPSSGWRSIPPLKRPASAAVGQMPRRIVINLNHHQQQTSEVSNQSVAAGAALNQLRQQQQQSAHGAYDEPTTIASPSPSRANPKRRNTRLLKTGSESIVVRDQRTQQEPSSVVSMQGEAMMNSVRRQGGIPAIIVEDESQMLMMNNNNNNNYDGDDDDDNNNNAAAKPMGKLMLGAEMVDRMTTSRRRTKPPVLSANEQHSRLLNFTAATNSQSHSGESASVEPKLAYSRRAELAPAYQQEENGSSIQMDAANNGTGRRSRADERTKAKWLGASRERKTFPSKVLAHSQKGPLALADQRQVHWNGDSQALPDKGNKRFFAYRSEGSVDGDSQVAKVNEVESSQLERFDPESNIDLAGHSSGETYQRDWNKRSRPVAGGKNFAPAARNVLEQGNLASANGMRILVAVDDDETDFTKNQPSNNRPEQNHLKQRVEQSAIKPSSTSSTATTRGSSSSSSSMDDRIAGFLEQLKLYTTREQLMKIANEMQQYPDQREARQQQTKPKLQQTSADPAQRSLGAAANQQVAQMEWPTDKPKQAHYSIRNNVPAPIEEGDFADFLVTSASDRGRNMQQDTEQTNGLKEKFLERKAQLRMRVQPEDSEDRPMAKYGGSVGQNKLGDELQSISGDSRQDEDHHSVGRENAMGGQDQNEYTDNRDLLSTLEASEKSYNSPNGGEDEDGQQLSAARLDRPLADTNDADSERSELANNEREDEEIKILEQVIDELVAAEREGKE